MSAIKPSGDCLTQKRKTKLIGSYYTADFYFEVTQNGIPGKHYSFRDFAFYLKRKNSSKNVPFIGMNKKQLLNEAELCGSSRVLFQLRNLIKVLRKKQIFVICKQ